MTRTHTDHGFLSDLAAEIAIACRGRWVAIGLQAAAIGGALYVLAVLAAIMAGGR